MSALKPPSERKHLLAKITARCEGEPGGPGPQAFPLPLRQLPPALCPALGTSPRPGGQAAAVGGCLWASSPGMANLLPRARYLSVVSWTRVNLDSACGAITSICVTTSGAQSPSSLIWKMEIIIFHALWDCCEDELHWNLGEVASSV